MLNVNAVEIFIVEGNPRDAELIVRALKKKNLSNNILVVEDGAEALDFFFCRGKYQERSFSNPPKVVLLDLKLPKIGGLEVLKIVKEDERTSSVPIVVVTSSRESPDIAEAYRLGVNSYVVKPVGFDQFLDAMNGLGLY